MDTGEFREPPFTSEDRFAELVKQLDRSQAELLQVIPKYVTNLTNGYRQALQGGEAETATKIFQETVEIIASDNELSATQRSEFIATLCKGVEDPRRKLFGNLAPRGDFLEDPETHEQITEDLQDYFESETAPQTIAREITLDYKCGYAEDIDELFGSIDPTSIERAIWVAQNIGTHVLEVGKMSVAIGIGIVLARQTLKKFGD